MRADGSTVKAHRMALILSGRDPGELCALHHCDVRLCVNPDHLFIGTVADNAQDAQQKGRLRGPAWSKHNLARLTPESVLEIRARFAGGESYLSISKVFGMTRSNISCVVRRVTWKHVA